MANLNRVQIIGRLGKDPDSRVTSGGKQVTSFSVAVTQHWRDTDGESQEKTEWINVETWGRLAETCQKYLSKGRLVYIEGRLQTDRYEKKGETRYYTKVVASQMQMLDRKKDEDKPEPLPPEEDDFPF